MTKGIVLSMLLLAPFIAGCSWDYVKADFAARCCNHLDHARTDCAKGD